MTMADIRAVVTQAVEAAGSVVGIRWGTEEPPHSVIDRVNEVEIRQYQQRIAAQTSVAADEVSARSTGFRRLAGYIFGGNRGDAKIAMTAPVAQTSDAARKSTISFFMPVKWTMETLPRPNDDNVTLVEVPAETVAVLRFTGDRSPGAVEHRVGQLRQALSSSNYRPTGQARAWFYDPPFTLPFRRRNEVVIPVEAA
ncbi:MAG: hypothetical protein QOH57_1927 [Mycobacterium sp.]|jgi:hypothetical protein|nr:hypothetical protein [Mycobacterium sp.]